MKNSEWWMTRKIWRWILVSLLPCVLSAQHAAALTFGKTLPDGSAATDYQWFADGDDAQASVPGRHPEENKPVWIFHAGHILMVKMSDGGGSDGSPQLSLRHWSGPHIAVRLEWRF